MLNAQTLATYSFGLDSFECGRFRSIPNNSKRLLYFYMSRQHLHRGFCQRLVAKVEKTLRTTKTFLSFFNRCRLFFNKWHLFLNKGRLLLNKERLLFSRGRLLGNELFRDQPKRVTVTVVTVFFREVTPFLYYIYNYIYIN